MHAFSWHDLLLWPPSQFHPIAHNKKRLNLDLGTLCCFEESIIGHERRNPTKAYTLKCIKFSIHSVLHHNPKVCLPEERSIIIFTRNDNIQRFITLLIKWTIFYHLCMTGLKGNSLYNTNLFQDCMEFISCSETSFIPLTSHFTWTKTRTEGEGCLPHKGPHTDHSRGGSVA